MKEKLTIPTGEKSVEVLRNELLATGKVAEFIDAEVHDLSEMPDGLPALSKIGVEIIDDYLTHRTVIVVDSDEAFKGHRERRVWRTELPLDQRDVYENNSIRRNIAGAALSAADCAIIDILETARGKKLKEERELLFAEFEKGWKVSEEYPDGVFSLEEKIEYTESRLKPFLLKVREVVVDK